MEPDFKDERQPKSLATDELKRLWVEACKRWASLSRSRTLKRNSTFAKKVCLFILCVRSMAMLASHCVASITSLH